MQADRQFPLACGDVAASFVGACGCLCIGGEKYPPWDKRVDAVSQVKAWFSVLTLVVCVHFFNHLCYFYCLPFPSLSTFSSTLLLLFCVPSFFLLSSFFFLHSFFSLRLFIVCLSQVHCPTYRLRRFSHTVRARTRLATGSRITGNRTLDCFDLANKVRPLPPTPAIHPGPRSCWMLPPPH